MKEEHRWRRRGPTESPKDDAVRTPDKTKEEKGERKTRTETTGSEAPPQSKKRGRQATGCNDPSQGKGPKARRTWPDLLDSAGPSRSSQIQGPTTPPPMHRGPPGSVPGPRRSPRLVARNGVSPDPEPDPPPSPETRGG